MNKKLILQVAVVIIALLFITELFFFGGTINFGGYSTPTENITGTAVFNGTIRTYDPVLVLPPDVNQSIIDEMRGRDEVTDVKVDQQSVVIETETRDDVFPLSVYLRELGYEPLSVANVALPQMIELQTYSGTENISAGYGAVRIVTEPFLDADSEVTVSIVGTATNGQLVSYTSAIILLEPVEISMSATVDELNYIKYTYSIPWEERNSLSNLSAYGQYEYDKADSVIFDPPLDISQIMAKKQFPYVLYIDAGSAQVVSSFDNLTKLQENFQDVSINLPPSTLTITTNETPEIPYESSVRYSYDISLQPDSTDYELGELSFSLTTTSEYDVNSTVDVSVEAIVSGSKVISVNSVSLPS